MKPGPKNLITDVAGLRVGNADDAVIKRTPKTHAPKIRR